LFIAHGVVLLVSVGSLEALDTLDDLMTMEALSKSQKRHRAERIDPPRLPVP
jgi:hypothetical protein